MVGKEQKIRRWPGKTRNFPTFAILSLKLMFHVKHELAGILPRGCAPIGTHETTDFCGQHPRSILEPPAGARRR